jgi:hypothetical protein
MMQAFVYTDHYQITLVDDDVEAGGAALGWDHEQATVRGFALTERSFSFNVPREDVVPVTLEILESEPALPEAAWSLVIEATIEARTGRLALLHVEETDELHLPLGRGTFRVRACGAGLAGIDPIEQEGSDRYLLQFWPVGEVRPPEVLRRPE